MDTDARRQKTCYKGIVTDTSPPLQFTRSRKITRPWFRLIAGLSIMVALLLMLRYRLEDIFPSPLMFWLTQAVRLALAILALILANDALSGFDETWTFDASHVAVASRTLFGRSQKRWPLDKAELCVRPDGFPAAYNLFVRIGKGDWMAVFSFDDKHVAAAVAARIEARIAACIAAAA